MYITSLECALLSLPTSITKVEPTHISISIYMAYVEVRAIIKKPDEESLPAERWEKFANVDTTLVPRRVHVKAILDGDSPSIAFVDIVEDNFRVEIDMPA